MSTSLRANLWLLLFTVVVCSVLYPLTLLGVGQAAFHDEAQCSLIRDRDGNVIGSRLIARPFSGDEYFQPRPSAVDYNARASGASNYGASNPSLRNRVARLLGPIVRYGPKAKAHGKEPEEPVGPDVEKWFQKDRYRDPEAPQKEKSGIVARWAQLHSGLAEDWIKDAGKKVRDFWLESKDAGVKAAWEKKTIADSFVDQWAEDFPEMYSRWRKENPKIDRPTTADLAGGFFESYAAALPGTWPYLADVEVKGEKRKQLYAVRQAGDAAADQNEIQAVFFEMWREEHPDVDLLKVPADMVTASASGLDPHITLSNALYQARWRVADALVKKFVKDKAIPADGARHAARVEKVHEEIVKLLKAQASPPLGGLVGVPLVNVLEVNLSLRKEMEGWAGMLR
jgi:K+-transporting ATPase ATPase C chain